jgi:hypothetical protein
MRPPVLKWLHAGGRSMYVIELIIILWISFPTVSTSYYYL